MPKIVSDARARQGGSGRPVLYVLIASLVLLAIYMVGLMSWSSKQAPDYASQSQDASRQQVTGEKSGTSSSASSSNTSGVPAANPAYPVPAQPSATGSTNSR